MGGIEESQRLFYSRDSLRTQELNLILMTKGGRRFLWKDIQTNTMPVINFTEDRGLTVIEPALSQNAKKKLVKNAKVIHIGPDYRDLIHWEPMIETDDFGRTTNSLMPIYQQQSR